ncbi:MAG: transcriptional repressor [Anaerolineae bacterium]|nr:MAG: transcriptional repressor [Anaerolineae bacterium]
MRYNTANANHLQKTHPPSQKFASMPFWQSERHSEEIAGQLSALGAFGEVKRAIPEQLPTATGGLSKERNMPGQSHTFAEDKFREMLRAAGCRVTAQRLLLLKLLHDSEGHAGADDLYHMARARDPRLSLSTVYRTLNILKEVGLVHELHLDDEHHHYELAAKSTHHHLICQDCGNVMEINCLFVNEILSHIEAEHDFKVMNRRIEFMGYCANCQAVEREG